MKNTALSFKKHIWIPAAVAIVVASIVVGLMVQVAFQQQAALEQANDHLKSTQAQIIKLKDKKASSNERLGFIANIANNQKETNCSGEWWNAWLLRIGFMGQKTADCRLAEKHFQDIVGRAKAVQVLLADEKAISDQLVRLRIDSSRANWPSLASKDAELTKDAINNLKVGENARPLIKASKKAVQLIISAWQSLNIANEKQDKDSYLSAELQLKDEYINLANLADLSDAQHKKLIDELIASAN